jgi:hypothetical protein
VAEDIMGNHCGHLIKLAARLGTIRAADVAPERQVDRPQRESAQGDLRARVLVCHNHVVEGEHVDWHRRRHAHAGSGEYSLICDGRHTAEPAARRHGCVAEPAAVMLHNDLGEALQKGIEDATRTTHNATAKRRHNNAACTCHGVSNGTCHIPCKVSGVRP